MSIYACSVRLCLIAGFNAAKAGYAPEDRTSRPTTRWSWARFNEAGAGTAPEDKEDQQLINGTTGVLQ